ncbi:hypothetical protein DJ90_6017 [Paenibacillus macerans]|uniref:Uncharacterized protein n=1 Tax=Paenibacillus macerans TaxID=44252 RepID=A0A090Y5R1_PAEMA|nr:hypothetical protein DJ90_6017 [Paenibacillus macerans]
MTVWDNPFNVFSYLAGRCILHLFMEMSCIRVLQIPFNPIYKCLAICGKQDISI